MLGMQHIALPLYRRLRRRQIKSMAEQDHVAILPNLDWAKSRAWLQSTSGELAGYADIYFDDSVTEEQIDEFVATLREIRDPENGQALAVEIHRESALGSGPFAPEQRHVIVLSGENTSIYTQLGRTSLWETRGVGRSVSSGIHHPDGVLYLYGAGAKKGATIAPAHIYDVVPTILSLMGLPLPDELDGKAMIEPFEQAGVKDNDAADGDLVMRKLRRLAGKTS
jgi:predicted AlkP superfamily phosphohydrolase/phosphomutase